MKISDLTRINELREVPFRRAWRTPEEVQEWLKENGYEYIDSGSFSDVYGRDEYIIKVQAIDSSNSSKTAKCLIAYARVSMRSNNPHFPKIYAIKTFRGEEHSITHYIIGTERLYPIEKDKIKIPKNVDKQEFFSFLTDALNLWDFSFPDMSLKDTEKLSYKYQTKNPNDPLVKAYQLIGILSRKYSSCFLDYHSDNTMMRKDGTLVLSDPIADA